MAKIVTVQILVDEDDRDNIADWINELLISAKVTHDGDDEERPAMVIDWSFGDPEPIHPDLEDAIVNGTYEEDEFTSDRYAK